MAAKEDLVEFAKQSHANALQVVGVLLNAYAPPIVKPVTPDMSVDEILRNTIGTVGGNLYAELIDVPSISDKLSKNLDELVKRLKQGK